MDLGQNFGRLRGCRYGTTRSVASLCQVEATPKNDLLTSLAMADSNVASGKKNDSCNLPQFAGLSDPQISLKHFLLPPKLWGEFMFLRAVGGSRWLVVHFLEAWFSPSLPARKCARNVAQHAMRPLRRASASLVPAFRRKEWWAFWQCLSRP